MGYCYDISSCSIKVPQEKATYTVSTMISYLKQQTVKRSQLESLAGRLVFFRRALDSGLALVRSTYNAIRLGKHPYSKIRLANVPLLLKDWNLLIRNLKVVKWKLLPQAIWYDVQPHQFYKIATDACPAGWGYM